MDVLLSACRAGPAGVAFRVDMTEKMLRLALAPRPTQLRGGRTGHVSIDQHQCRCNLSIERSPLRYNRASDLWEICQCGSTANKIKV